MKATADADALDPPIAQAFKGYLSAYTLENEAAAWRLIREVADDALSKYSTTLE